MKSSSELYQHFCDGVVFEPREIQLEWAGIRVALRSNSLALLDELSIYFSHCISSNKEFSTAGVGIRIAAIEQEEPLVEMDFQDWRREGGKTGRKDSYAEFCKIVSCYWHSAPVWLIAIKLLILLFLK